MNKIILRLLFSFIILLTCWVSVSKQAHAPETVTFITDSDLRMSALLDGDNSQRVWLTTWSQAQKGQGLYPINDNGKTVEYELPIHNSGQALRFTLGNYYSDNRLGIEHVSVSYNQQPFQEVTVNGKAAFDIPSQLSLKTDPLPLDLLSGSVITIRIAYQDQPELNRPVSGTILSREAKRSNKGDYALADTFEVDTTYSDVLTEDEVALKSPRSIGIDEARYILTLEGLDVLAENQGGTIVAFGDSITEQDRWVEPLRNNITQELGETYSLVNAGISGNRLLKNLPDLPRRAQYFGLAGIERFEHDVFDVNANVTAVIVSLGVNDIQQPGNSARTPLTDIPSLAEVIEGYDALITVTKNHQSKIFIATITPFIGYAKDLKDDEKERLRQQINQWIRDNKEIDGVIDFDKVLADPKQKKLMASNYSTIDKLHPNEQGGLDMAAIIDVSLLQ